MKDNVVNMRDYAQAKIDDDEPPYDMYMEIMDDLMPHINRHLAHAAEKLDSANKFRYVGNCLAHTLYLNIIAKTHGLLELTDEQKMNDIQRFTNAILEMYPHFLEQQKEQDDE